MNFLKSGAETASFHKMINVQRRILAFLGLNHTSWNIKRARRAVILYIPVVLFYLFNFTSAITNTNPEVVLGIILCSSMTLLNVPPKIITYISQAEKLQLLMTMVTDATDNSYTSLEEEKRLLEKYTTISRIMTNVIFWSYIGVHIVLCLIPYLINFIVPIWYIPLPFKIIGFSQDSHPGYDLHMLLMVLCTGYTAIILSTDLIFFYFTLFISFRFELCQHLASKLGDMNSEYNTEDEQSNLLRQICKSHADIVKFCKLCSELFSLIFFFETGCILFSMVTSFTLLEMSPSIAIPTMINSTSVFFLFCIFGELVKIRNMDTSNAIYCSQWYNLRKNSDKKMILFLLANSQKDLSFSAFGMYTLSLDLYVKVMKAAFSYFTFLQTTM